MKIWYQMNSTVIGQQGYIAECDKQCGLTATILTDMKWRYMSHSDSNYTILLAAVVGQLGYISLLRVLNHADVVLSKGKTLRCRYCTKGYQVSSMP